MKYLQNGGFQSHPLMKITLIFTLLLLTGFWITNFAIYFSKMGFTPQSVKDYYLGSEELFKMPRTYGSMLEVTHAHLAMIALVLLLLTHLLIFAPYSSKAKVIFISSSFVFALVNESSGWLVRFVNETFAVLKVVGFLGFQSMLGFLISALAIFLLKSRPRGSIVISKDSKHESEASLQAEIQNNQVSVEQLRPGEQGLVRSIIWNGADMSGLMEMGITPGTRVKVIKFAPLGDPIEVKIRGYHLSIRRSDARNILLEREKH